MENVFALTTVEKRKGVERAKTTGHQPGLCKRVDAGACPLPTRHARQTVWFLYDEKRKEREREGERKDTVRMQKILSL